MTAKPSIDPAEFLHEHLAQASPDLLRELMGGFINTLLSADADSVCGASYGVRDPARTNSRNGHRHRDLDTRIGTLDVAIPKLREGSYFPEWLLERRRRAEAALTSVVATCYLLGVSTRRMDRLVQSLGITGLSKSQVSVMARDLDELVRDFRERKGPRQHPWAVSRTSITRSLRVSSRPWSASCSTNGPEAGLTQGTKPNSLCSTTSRPSTTHAGGTQQSARSAPQLSRNATQKALRHDHVRSNQVSAKAGQLHSRRRRNHHHRESPSAVKRGQKT